MLIQALLNSLERPKSTMHRRRAPLQTSPTPPQKQTRQAPGNTLKLAFTAPKSQPGPRKQKSKKTANITTTIGRSVCLKSGASSPPPPPNPQAQTLMLWNPSARAMTTNPSLHTWPMRQPPVSTLKAPTPTQPPRHLDSTQQDHFKRLVKCFTYTGPCNIWPIFIFEINT